MRFMIIPHRQRLLNCWITVGVLFACATEKLSAQTPNPYDGDYRSRAVRPFQSSINPYDQTRQSVPVPNRSGVAPNREQFVPEPAGIRAHRLRPMTDGGTARREHHEPTNFQTVVQSSTNPNSQRHVTTNGPGSTVDYAIRATIRTSRFRTETLTKEAMTLAAKGATFSANAKLIDVLESAASQLDDSEGTSRHNAALYAGLTALREAEDFSSDSNWLRSKTVRSWASLGHSTPVLREYAPDSLSRIDAIELYYSYASRQLAAAVAGSPEGSTALCYLGRLQPMLQPSGDQKPQLMAARMVAMHRAAMKSDAGNYRAANELGVILANNGQLGPAKEQFLMSAEICKRPENLRNLGIVLRKMGSETESEKILQLASHQSPASSRFAGQNGTTPPLIYQVNQQEFAGRLAEPLPPLLPTPERPDLDSQFTSGIQANTPVVTSGRSPRWWRWGRWSVFSNRAIQQTSYEVEGEEISSSLPVVVDHPRNLSCSPEYELRVDDQVGFVFRLNGKPSATPYRLNVGDTIRISSLIEEKLLIDTVVQPDGMIVLPQIGTVAAAGNTIESVQRELDERYGKYIKEPSIAVTPVTINKTVEELRNAIVNRTGNLVNMNGQIFNSMVAPDGDIQLPAIGSVPAAGLTLNELRNEIELRYADIGSGIEVTPVLQKRAPRNIYVMGEVQKPGRYELVGPTTVMQAIAMAGGWNKGGNVWEVVVFRRDDQYRLMATRVNVYPGLYNTPELDPCDVWLRDTDLVIVPKLKIQVWDDWIEMVFTRGIYGVVPFNGITFSFFKDLSTLGALN